MKLFLCSTLLVATQANFFRHVLKSHRVPHFLGAGSRHATNKFHAVFQIVHDSDLASTAVEYIDCGIDDATTCMSGTPTVIHTVTSLSTATVNADAAVTNVEDTNNNVYDLEYTPSQGYNHIITKLELNNHTIIEESYLCAAGHVPNSTVAGCDPCTAGKYAERGANSCSNCAAGKESPGAAAAQSQCVPCAAGKFNPTAGNACQDCVAGTANPNTGSTLASDCVDCVAGKYQDTAGQSSCNVCVPHSTSGGNDVGYQDATGQASCKNCSTISSGYYVTTTCTAAADRGETQCGTAGSGGCGGTYTACIKGSPITGGGADESCISGGGGGGGGGGSSWTCTCTNGDGSNNGASAGCTTCTGCDAGYKLNSGACQQCDAGKYQGSNSHSNNCDNCVAGKYQNLQGQSSCKNCGKGKYVVAGQNAAITDCQDCGTGKYNDQDAAASCKDCADGHQTEDALGVANSGATKCEDCVAGKTDHDSSSSTACDDCVAGKYEANSQGTGACDDCDVGTYSTTPAATAQSQCLDCNTGPNTGLTTKTAGSNKQSDCVFAVTMYGYVRANLTGTCQDECVEWHNELKDNFVNANDVHRLNATGAETALCNLLKKTGEMIKQQGC